MCNSCKTSCSCPSPFKLGDRVIITGGSNFEGASGVVFRYNAAYSVAYNLAHVYVRLDRGSKYVGGKFIPECYTEPNGFVVVSIRNLTLLVDRSQLDYEAAVKVIKEAGGTATPYGELPDLDLSLAREILSETVDHETSKKGYLSGALDGSFFIKSAVLGIRAGREGRKAKNE